MNEFSLVLNENPTVVEISSDMVANNDVISITPSGTRDRTIPHHFNIMERCHFLPCELAGTVFHYKGKNIPGPCLGYLRNEKLGLTFLDKLILVSELMDKNIVPTTRSLTKLFKAYSVCKTATFLNHFAIEGDLKIPGFKETSKYKEMLEELEAEFKKSTKFGGRVPRIAKSIAAVAVGYRISPAEIVDNFSIPATRKLLACGASEMETALLVYQFRKEKAEQIADSEEALPYIVKALDKAFVSTNTKTRESFTNAALWISEHLQTSESLLKKVTKNAAALDLAPDTSVDAIMAKLSELKAREEIKAIEKAYKKPKFKFSECRCELKFSETIFGNYKAEILKADDVRQVRLGYDTSCCQHLFSDGESSMMHGLLHPKAGFWVLTNANSGKILAQAEVWEENESTLVFDNIEFANDADISLYKGAIAKWLEESEYANAKMGAGYNTLASENMRSCDAVTPPVTPREIYVISYEEGSEAPVFKSEDEAKTALEEGRVTYFDYVYCDSERYALWMKENGNLEPFFARALGYDVPECANEGGEDGYESYEPDDEEEFDENDYPYDEDDYPF